MNAQITTSALEFATAVLAKMIPAGLGGAREIFAVANCMAEQFGITVNQAADILKAAAEALQGIRL